MGGGGEKKGEKGGDSGEFVGNRGRGKREWGGGRFSPNVLKHTDTCTPRCLSRLLPWENPRGRSHGQSSQLAASDWIQIVVSQVKGSVGTPSVQAGKVSRL